MVGQKTLYIDKNYSLEFEQGRIIASGEEDLKIPICDIAVIIVASLRVKFTAYLLVKLSESNVKIIFCNEKYNPCCEMVPYYSNSLQSERLYEQIENCGIFSQIMWTKIVRMKIAMQMEVMKKIGAHNINLMQEYINEIELDDSSNREGMAARIYFNDLFGKSFNRSDLSNINSALNYGYTILLSHINRILSGLGYNTSLGLKHCSSANHFNLSCDLIEPFRPFVDYFVLSQKDRVFDKEYKKELVLLTYNEISYNNKKYELYNAIEAFVFDIMNNVKNTDYELKDICFAK